MHAFGGIVSEIEGPKIGGHVSIEPLARVVVASLHVKLRTISTLGPLLWRRRLDDPTLPIVDHDQGAEMSDYPEDLKYSAEHEWVRSGNATT